jgi:riboflavin transporter FmnP
MKKVTSQLVHKTGALSQKIVIGYFFLLSIWWISIYVRGLYEGTENNAFTLIYPWVSLFGGLIGIGIAKKWGGLKSYFGSSLVYFSLGLLAQFFGQFIYAILIYILGVDPYPSIGDVGYYGSTIFYILGALKLMKVVSPSWKKHLKPSTVLTMIVIPLAMLLLSYQFFLRGYEFGNTPWLTMVLDFAYPLTQAIYVSLAIGIFVASRKMLGGIMRIPTVFLLSALVVQYICDFMFLYQSSQETWYVAGPNDYLYFLAYCAMTLAIIQVGHTYSHITASHTKE